VRRIPSRPRAGAGALQPAARGLRHPSPALRPLVAVGLLAVVAVACSGGPAATPPGGSSPGSAVSPAPSASAPSASAPSAATGSGSASPAAAPVKLTVGLGYIPSVQFAQFYLAQEAGYYRQAGLDVQLINKIDPELVTLVGQGAVDLALADGTSVVPAVSQGIPIRYVATIYARFPNVVFAKASSGIRTAADLKGKKVGTPGKYGSGWIMLQALLAGAGLTTDDIDVVLFPDFSQLGCVERDECAAATGFANNEPVQLQLAGITPVVLRVDDVVPLQGNGLITGTATLAAKEPALRAFIAATLRAEREIIADPQKGLEAAIAAVPELGQNRDQQLAVLQATVAMWQNPRTATAGLGAIDRAGWQATIDFLSRLPGGLVPNPVTVDQLVSDALLPSP
jgi:NitT/TauT family transport system substrate-binding protein